MVKAVHVHMVHVAHTLGIKQKMCGIISLHGALQRGHLCLMFISMQMHSKQKVCPHGVLKKSHPGLNIAYYVVHGQS